MTIKKQPKWRDHNLLLIATFFDVLMGSCIYIYTKSGQRWKSQGFLLIVESSPTQCYFCACLRNSTVACADMSLVWRSLLMLYSVTVGLFLSFGLPPSPPPKAGLAPTPFEPQKEWACNWAQGQMDSINRPFWRGVKFLGISLSGATAP